MQRQHHAVLFVQVDPRRLDSLAFERPLGQDLGRLVEGSTRDQLILSGHEHEARERDALGPREHRVVDGERGRESELVELRSELDASPTLLTRSPEPDPTPAERRQFDDEDTGAALIQQKSDADALDEDYDPWEGFNEKMFSFNRGLDTYILKPAARVYRIDDGA